MKAVVNIFLKEGVLDPQGKATRHALESLGFKGVKSVRIGKQIILDLKAVNKEEAQKEVEQMSETLLANTVIEDYNIEIVEWDSYSTLQITIKTVAVLRARCCVNTLTKNSFWSCSKRS